MSKQVRVDPFNYGAWDVVTTLVQLAVAVAGIILKDSLLLPSTRDGSRSSSELDLPEMMPRSCCIMVWALQDTWSDRLGQVAVAERRCVRSV